MKRTLLPPFTEALSSAIVRAAEEAWTTRNPAQVAQACSKHALWRQRDTFLAGHDHIIEFLTRKSLIELYYRLIKAFWACTDNRISVRFQCEWQHANGGHGFRTHGNKHRAFDAEGYMTRRDMSANDIPIRSSERRIGVSIETRGLSRIAIPSRTRPQTCSNSAGTTPIASAQTLLSPGNGPSTKGKSMKNPTITSAAIGLLALIGTAGMLPTASASESTQVRYNSVQIEDVEIFYREAGDPDKPTLLLLHGFPTSSHMFRDLMPRLSDRYHLVAPDYPGYGFSSMPEVDTFDYSFDNIARLMEEFTAKLELDRYSLYLMDYGAPIGFRLATSRPERIESLIIQNGNAYIEGIDNNFWEPIRAYWKDRSAINEGLDNPWWANVKNAYKQSEMANEDALRFLLSLGATQWQYTNGVPDTSLISPDNWGHVQPLLDRPGNQEIQLQMFYSYGSNPPLYPAWQAYLREYQPPTLIVWGEHDEIFPPAGAEPYKRDLADLEYHMLDTGHFALESHGPEIAALMSDFLDRKLSRESIARY